MPYRKVPLIPGEIYHIFNRSIAKQPIFKNKKNYSRFIELTDYYRFQNPPYRYSHFNRLSEEIKNEAYTVLQRQPLEVEILAFCVMPNHYHFLLKSINSRGLSNFMRNIQNSYSKYFNIKYNRTGSVFQAMFKAVRIESEEQFLHVSRYIHLNPVTSFIIEIDKLDTYPWSSFPDYISLNPYHRFLNTQYLISQFSSSLQYKKFVYDQTEYQRELEKIKHLVLDS